MTAANATFGDSRRNSLRAPGIDTTNLSLGKTFNFSDRVGLQIRADASNVFNHPDFDAPDGNFNDPVNLSTPGRPQGAGTIGAYYCWRPQHADQRADRLLAGDLAAIPNETLLRPTTAITPEQ